MRVEVPSVKRSFQPSTVMRISTVFMAALAAVASGCAQEGSAGPDAGSASADAAESGPDAGQADAAQEIAIAAYGNLAGAIGSLTWANQQFLYQGAQHGGFLQSALFITPTDLDGFRFSEPNPTEGGAAGDGYVTTADGHAGHPSSSALISIGWSGNTLTTTAQMAYWLPPKKHTDMCSCEVVDGGVTRIEEPDGGPQTGCANGCNQLQDGNPDGAYLPNPFDTPLSQTAMTKDVTVGFRGLQDVIEYRVSFDVEETYPYSAIAFQAPVAFMPGEVFTDFSSYDPHLSVAAKVNEGGSRLPIIVSTVDGSHALGIYSPDLSGEDGMVPAAGCIPGDFVPAGGAGGNAFCWVNKSSGYLTETKTIVDQYQARVLSTTFHTSADGIPNGRYSMRVYLIVGTLRDVQRSMSLLHQSFNP